MSSRNPRVAAACAALGVGVILAAIPAAPATAGDFGEHVSTCSQTHGLDAEHNPGMHRGVTGWDPTEAC